MAGVDSPRERLGSVDARPRARLLRRAHRGRACCMEGAPGRRGRPRGRTGRANGRVCPCRWHLAGHARPCGRRGAAVGARGGWTRHGDPARPYLGLRGGLASMSSEPTACATTGENIPSLRDFLLYFLRLGTFGFGGPIALAGHMQHDLVETRKWISPQDYREGLALAQLSPGPLAAQLAMYLGWVRGGAYGAAAVGAAFVLPSFAMVIVLARFYVGYGGLPWMQGAFYGVGAAVISIIVRSAVKLVKLTLGRDTLLW